MSRRRRSHAQDVYATELRRRRQDEETESYLAAQGEIPGAEAGPRDAHKFLAATKRSIAFVRLLRTLARA